MTPQSSASFRTVTSLLTDRRLRKLAVWFSLNNLELNSLKTVEMIVDFRRNPPALTPLTIMKSTVTAEESFRFLSTTLSQDLKWDNHIESIVKKAQQTRYFIRQLRTQLYSEAALLCHHWIHPLHVNNCLVQLSFQIRPQMTTEGSPDCWANH